MRNVTLKHKFPERLTAIQMLDANIDAHEQRVGVGVAAWVLLAVFVISPLIAWGLYEFVSSVGAYAAQQGG